MALGYGPYADSAADAKRLIKEMADCEPAHDLIAVPDSQVRGVWLVADPTDRRAWIVYTGEADFEEADHYEQAEMYLGGEVF